MSPPKKIESIIIILSIIVIITMIVSTISELRFNKAKLVEQTDACEMKTLMASFADDGKLYVVCRKLSSYSYVVIEYTPKVK
jgi:hypothetical protein